jgi:hypothetical protein
MIHSGTMKQSCRESKERLIAAHFCGLNPQGATESGQRMNDSGHYWQNLTVQRGPLRSIRMTLCRGPIVQLIALGGLLIAACHPDQAYDDAIRQQQARAAAGAEEQRMAEAEADAKAEAERVQRDQAELAFESAPPELLSEDQLHQVLGYYCGDCHFTPRCTDGNCEWEGLYLDDVNEMLQQGTVIPGNAEGSPLIEQMREHRVTLPDGVPHVTEVAIKLVADFINHLPAASDADAGPASR